MSKQTVPKIAVLGSINQDVVIRCAHLPSPGETIIAESSLEIPGGKGANQAVAAARLGADVFMIGRVGNDDAGTSLLKSLQNDGVNTQAVFRSTPNPEQSEIASGLAIVMVEQSGENSIVVVPGANGIINQKDIDQATQVIEQSDVLLVQLEIPVETVMYACKIARSAGVRIILDPAPAPANIPEGFFDVDLICPNQSEATALLGWNVNSIDDACTAARELVQRGAAKAVITMGKQGAVLCDGESVEIIPPFDVTAVDSTAAGDAFAGAFAVRWAEQDSIYEAARFACATGALAASRPGAQPGMPWREEVEELMKQVASRGG